MCRAFTAAQVKQGDNIFLAIPNHTDLSLPIYAGLIGGNPTLAVDCNYGERELEFFISLAKPKITFCIKSNADIIRKVIQKIKLNVLLIILDDPYNGIDVFISQFTAGGKIDKFTPPLFDLKTPAWLVATSGTTGDPKVATLMHRNLWNTAICCFMYLEKYPKPTKLLILMSPPQWITCGVMMLGSALLVFPRVQTMLPLTVELCSQIFAKYKPTLTLISPNKLMQLFHSGQCDMSSLRHILVGGSVLSEKLNQEFNERYPNCQFLPAYGMTEFGGVVTAPVPNGPLANIGLELPVRFEYRLVDPDSGLDVTGPNGIGELWLKDDCPFGGYYERDDETSQLYSADGYARTGDLIRRDENGFYFFVERLKTMLKYCSSHVYPSEIEEILEQHDAVNQAAVTGVPDPTIGDLVTAFVVLRDGRNATAADLCDFVAKKVADSKRIRGGVVFVDKIPLTSVHKIDRRKLKNIVLTAKREF